jgi:hypothetical protein
MARARDIANIINSGTFLTPASASTTYLPQTSPVVGFKNKIINGSMRFWERGTSFTSPGGAYTADRYKITQNSPTGTYVASRQSAGLQGFQYCMRVQRSSGQTATGGLFLGYAMESNDVIPLQGKSLVFSFYARKGSNFSSTLSTIGVSLFTGTGTDGHAFVNLTNEVAQINSSETITDSWQRFSYVFNMPLNSSELRININYNPTGTASTNDYFDITGIQLEIGSIITEFEHKSTAIELSLCQRYFYKQNSVGYFAGNSGNSTVARGVMKYAVRMRATPTITVFSGTNNAGTQGHVYISNTNSTTNIDSVSQITNDGWDTIARNANLPNSSYLYACSYRADAEL